MSTVMKIVGTVLLSLLLSSGALAKESGIVMGSTSGVALSGTIKLPNGTGVTGQLQLQLAQTTSVLNICLVPNQIVPRTPVLVPVRGGTVQGGQLLLTPSDCMSPRSFYDVRLVDNSRTLLLHEYWYVPTVSTATVDVGTLSVTMMAGYALTIAVPQPIVSTPNINQTITQPSGTALTIAGGGNFVVSVTGTATISAPLSIAAILNSTGLQIFNSTATCTTGATVGALCTTGAITLPVAYSDANYRVSCTGQSPTNVPIVETYTKSNSSFTVTVAALTSAAASFGSFDCTVAHN